MIVTKTKIFIHNLLFYIIGCLVSKTQHFVPLNNAESISVDEVKIIKNGSEYIRISDQTDYLMNLSKELAKKPYKEFNFNGISKEDCVKMCLEHDNNIINKKSHPLTEDQTKMNELNKQKQKDLTLSKNKNLNTKDLNTKVNET